MRRQHVAQNGKSRFRSVRLIGALPLLAAGMALWMAGGSVPAAAQTANGRAVPSAYDPRALQLLDRMAAAYAHLSTLEQTTEFSSSLLPLTPTPATDGSTPKSGSEQPKLQRTLRLLFESPNRLRLESRDTDPKTNQPVVSQWDSDGKEFWSYASDTRTYTHEKAPRHIHDFQKLATLNSGTLEMTMLIGINPFANLRNEVDSVACTGTESVHNVATDVVVLKNETDQERTEVRFYIGKEDSLLRRCVIETVPILATPAASNKVGDALDELEEQAAPGTPPTPSAPLPMKTRIAYDNTINLHPAFDVFTFAFKVPDGASLYMPLDPHQGLSLKYPTTTLSLLDRLKAKAKGHKLRIIR
ncbi:MAG TPA: DUF2092 domain-containing protein [Chthonomonadaceae bacterium]|nr:DUF2092 domain-containing protein [Chthonomonadaceae bacterium]